jgi:hypothetical protein
MASWASLQLAPCWAKVGELSGSSGLTGHLVKLWRLRLQSSTQHPLSPPPQRSVGQATGQLLWPDWKEIPGAAAQQPWVPAKGIRSRRGLLGGEVPLLCLALRGHLD